MHRSRDGRVKKSGGGVALAFNTGNCNFKNRQLKHIGKQFKVMCVFVVYVPPSTRVAEVDQLKEALGTEISLAKMTFKDPIIIINGDLNHRDFADSLGEVGDFSILPTGPARGASTIDMLYLNIQGSITESSTLPPLQSTSGVLSDHLCVVAGAKFPVQRGYEWTINWRRTRNANSKAAIAEEMRRCDWSDLQGSVVMMAKRLEKVIGELTDKHFPLVRVRKRFNEHPWINWAIRRQWKRKIRIYKKGERSQAWWETEELLQTKIQIPSWSAFWRMGPRAGASTQQRGHLHPPSPYGNGNWLICSQDKRPRRLARRC